MKSLFLVAVFAFATPAFAGPAEDTYVSTRDKLITAINRPGLKTEVMTSRDDAGLATLTKQLTAMIGPLQIKGFTQTGKSNLETLVNEVGFGRLDGLAYKGEDGETALVVTTPELLRRWAVGVDKTWSRSATGPEQLAEQIFHQKDFYTRAITSDAAIVSYGNLPVQKPQGVSVVHAILAIETQDDNVSEPPTAVAVAALAGDRVVVGLLKPRRHAEQIAACQALVKDFEKRSDALMEAYRASGLKNEKLFNQSTKVQSDGADAYRKCYFEKASGTDFLKDVTAQAQALLDSLAR